MMATTAAAARLGNLLALSAAAFPERVACLVNFDGVLGLYGTHPGLKSEDPRWHHASYAAELKVRHRPPKTFPSMAAAIERAHTGEQFPKARHTAERLVRLPPPPGGRGEGHATAGRPSAHRAFPYNARRGEAG